MNTAFLNAKNDFLAAAKRTYESGIQTGTGGNLSVRIPGGKSDDRKAKWLFLWAVYRG